MHIDFIINYAGVIQTASVEKGKFKKPYFIQQTNQGFPSKFR